MAYSTHDDVPPSPRFIEISFIPDVRKEGTLEPEVAPEPAGLNIAFAKDIKKEGNTTNTNIPPPSLLNPSALPASVYHSMYVPTLPFSREYYTADLRKEGRLEADILSPVADLAPEPAPDAQKASE